MKYFDADEWKILVDASENDKDLSVDYRTFETCRTAKIRLRIQVAPKGIQPGLVSITAFEKQSRML